MIYLFIRFLCSVGVRFFFKELEVNGKEHIPTDAGYVLAINHPNSLMDAIICGVASPISLHYLARSDVFISPWDAFLSAIQMMPIYRMRDGIKKLQKNEEIFNRCYELINQDAGILIFSETNTAKEYGLRPISKGTARLAINAQLACQKPIYILPAGISYVNHNDSGHKVFLNYGQPLSISQYLLQYRDHPAVALNTLKVDIAHAIKDLLIIAERDEQYESKAEIIQQYGDMCDYQELTKLIADVDSVIRDKKHTKSHWILGLVSLPHMPIFYLIDLILDNINDPQFIMAVKFLVSTIVLPLYWLLIFLVALPFIGCWISSVIVGTMICSLLIRAQLK